ncbi:hypothetical protein [Plesiomonas shigelloides]|uniref:Uncharacterized protein n=1 Tax=Plesiomonas shigelloides 302-73 TaxID=1315976 RepID=R8AMU0_PLESH|nr:hypothetical protein [Plesiomonas shigelloides]EON87664.1 hypothetical protein PLESHI_15523 [Plesiomonas shigelloides 302-73]
MCSNSDALTFLDLFKNRPASAPIAALGGFFYLLAFAAFFLQPVLSLLSASLATSLACRYDLAITA